jgi:hypothetical protein
MAATVTPAASPARPRGAGRRAGQAPEEGRQLQPGVAEADTRQGEMVGSKWVSWNRLALPVSAAVNKPDPAQLAFPLIPLVRLSETVAPRWVRGALVTKRPERERQDCQDDTDAEPTPDVHDAMIVHGSPQGSGTDDAGGLCGVDSAGADPGAGAGVAHRHPDSARVDGMTISYQSGRRGYTAPFATNAQLIIGQQHHQAAQRTPVERSSMPAWPPLPRIRTRPA